MVALPDCWEGPSSASNLEMWVGLLSLAGPYLPGQAGEIRGPAHKWETAGASQGYRLLFQPLRHFQPWGKALPTLCLPPPASARAAPLNLFVSLSSSDCLL